MWICDIYIELYIQEKQKHKQNTNKLDFAFECVPLMRMFENKL